MPAYENLLYEQTGPIVTVTLNRPQKLNALTDALMHELGNALDAIAADDSIRVVILTGAGRAFSAGYDLSPREHPLTTVQDWRWHGTASGCDVVMKMWDLPKPVLGAIRGYALGGGCDLVLGCDMVIASEDATFGEPEVRGVSSPPTLLMPWVIGMKKAKELLLTGDSIPANEAERLGIVNKVVPPDQLEATARALAEKLARVPPISIKLNKAAINRSYEIMGLKSAIAYGAEIFTLLLMTPDSAEFGKKVAEKGLRAALAERDAAFQVK